MNSNELAVLVNYAVTSTSVSHYKKIIQQQITILVSVIYIPTPYLQQFIDSPFIFFIRSSPVKEG